MPSSLLEQARATDYAGAVETANPGIRWFHGRDDDYQGDWMSVGVGNDGRWWLVAGSYGSCSGCDWLEGLDTEADAAEFWAAMKKRALIGSTWAEARQYLERERGNVGPQTEGALAEAIEAVEEAIPVGK